jgi:inosose dehydratase
LSDGAGSVATYTTWRRPRADGEPLAEAPVGIVPIIWNNADLPALGPRVPAGEVLDEIARLGYAGTQLGVGFPRGDALARELRSRDLRLAEVYAAIPCQRDGPTSDAMDEARELLAELHAAGGDVLVVALQRDEEREAWVGRAVGAPRLTEGGWRSLGQVLDALGSEAGALGHPLAFHNHSGTYVETPDELDRLTRETEPDRVGLCLDVGHAALGGGDPVAMLDQYGGRVLHVHLKDIAPEPLLALREGRLTGFAAALNERIFAPLGGGILDLPSVLAALAARGYRGWLMVEQDTSWEPASEAAAIGRRVLDATLRWMAASPTGEAS